MLVKALNTQLLFGCITDQLGTLTPNPEIT